MCDAKQRDEWNRTSHLLALIRNVNTTSGRPVAPAEMNPFLAAEYKARRPKSKDVGLLARMCGVQDVPADTGLLPKPRKRLVRKLPAPEES